MRRPLGNPIAVLAIGLLSTVLMGCSGSSKNQVDSSFIHLPGAGGTENAPRMAWAETDIDLGLVAAGESRELVDDVRRRGHGPSSDESRTP